MELFYFLVVLLHSGLEFLLSVSNVDLPGVLALYLVDYNRLPANVSVVTSSCSSADAVTWLRLEVFAADT